MPSGERVRTWAVGAWCVVALSADVAQAQTNRSRVEAGGQVNVLRLSDSAETGVGFGGRVTIDLTPWLSIESEGQFLPADTLAQTSVLSDGSRVGLRYERRRSTLLVGAKAGFRAERIGVFVKLRPGVTRLSDRGVECLGEVCALVLLAVPQYRPEFAVDVGGVIEVYPSRRWLARLDVGSLVVRHRGSAPPCGGSGCTSANLAVAAGLGVRF